MVITSHAMTATLAPTPTAAWSEAPAGSIEERAIAAVLACVARHGLSKTTIDDVARQAGCSRATLYRYFDGGKQELVKTAVRAEMLRVMTTVRDAADDTATLEDAVVAMLLEAGRALEHHEALRFVCDFEPELLLPHLTFAGGDRLLAKCAVALEPAFERFVDERHRAAEWVARVGLVFWFSPTAPLALTDEPALRAYVRAFVLPAVQPSIPVSPRG
jgi:AcrR family transcriptional regulator